ncbi:MAG TPA: hypothetical protein VF489_01970 [Sphingobium sp.]
MLSEIASLDERMSQGGDWMAFREEIVELHRRATTQEEYGSLLRAHSILGLLADQVYDEDTAREIKKIHHAEYLNFLNKEAIEGGDLINPAMLARITEREVEAGRLDPDDDFRQMAVAGGQVLGDSTYTTAKPSRRGNWVALAFVILAVVLWALSVHPFGFSALWLIAVGFVAGTIVNNREATQIKHKVEVERARRGY